MKRYSWYIIIVWMLLGGPLWAQAPALEVYLSDSVMTVGDPLYVELYLTEADAEMLYIDLAPFQESDWELLEQTRLEEGGLLLTVTNFADRAQLFPPIHIRYQQAGQEKQVSSSPLPVQVNLVAAEEATPGLRPIKEVRPARHASTLWWLIGGLGLLVLILLALLFRRRQKEAALAPFQQLDPRQQCLQQLQALEGQPAQQQAEQAPVALSQLAQTLFGLASPKGPNLIGALRNSAAAPQQTLATLLEEWEALRYLPEVPPQAAAQLLSKSRKWVEQ